MTEAAAGVVGRQRPAQPEAMDLWQDDDVDQRRDDEIGSRERERVERSDRHRTERGQTTATRPDGVLRDARRVLAALGQRELHDPAAVERVTDDERQPQARAPVVDLQGHGELVPDLDATGPNRAADREVGSGGADDRERRRDQDEQADAGDRQLLDTGDAPRDERDGTADCGGLARTGQAEPGPRLNRHRAERRPYRGSR